MFVDWRQDQWFDGEGGGVCRGLCLLWFERQGQIFPTGFEIRGPQIVHMAQLIHRRLDPIDIECRRHGLLLEKDWGESHIYDEEDIPKAVDRVMHMCWARNRCYVIAFHQPVGGGAGHVIGLFGVTKGFDPNMGFWMFDGSHSMVDWIRMMLTKYVGEGYTSYNVRTLILVRKWARSGVAGGRY